MAVPREVITANSIPIPGTFAVPTGKIIPFGAALVGGTFTKGSETVQQMAMGDQYLFGWAVRRPGLFPKGAYDGFYSYKDPVPVFRGEAVGLVICNNGTAANIDFGDYLEVADLGVGAGAGGHGILEEAGAQAGKTYTDSSLAMALETVIMTAHQHPTVAVVANDAAITVTSGVPTTMGLSEGDLILLEDDNGLVQVNAVASGLTATSIPLLLPAIALSDTTNDMVTKIFQCRMRQVI